MATISSHLLNGADGTHANGVTIKLVNINTGVTLVESRTDETGRFNQSVELKDSDLGYRYELVINTSAYWSGKGVVTDQVVDEIVLRFSMPDPDARYHKPVIIAPNSYSTWSSLAE